MATNQLVAVSTTSGGVVLPRDELRDEGLLQDGEVADCLLHVRRAGPGIWVVARTDRYDFAEVSQMSRRVFPGDDADRASGEA